MAKFVAVVPPPQSVPPAPAPPTGAHLATQQGTGKMPVVAPGATVHFQSGAHRPPRQQDDTAEIVNKKAVQYMARQARTVVSRLVLVKDGAEQSFPLTRDTYTVGRHRNNDIVVSDPKVSSFHARLDRSPDGFTVVDLKSRNGSFINSKRVETGPLKNGDELKMGPAKLVYREDMLD